MLLLLGSIGCSGASTSTPDAGPAPDGGQVDAGRDAGLTDAGSDAGPTDAGSDAGLTDAGSDAGPTDAGLPDAGLPDAGLPDAGPPDAGLPDAGLPDAGLPDAGLPDAGLPDAGLPDAGVDSGLPSLIDAGLTDAGLSDFDAGLDCNDLDAGDEQLALAIHANPTNVLSAAAIVSWCGALSSIFITYSSDMDAGPSATPPGGAGQTPAVSISDATSPKVLPVLLLQPDTTYEMQAIAQDADGGTITSNVVTFTTGPLPTGLPKFVVADGGTASPGYTLISLLPTNENSVEYVPIVDGQGNIVWYYKTKPALAGEFEQQADGTFVLALYDPADVIPGFSGQTAVQTQIDVLGNVLRTWPAVSVPTAQPPLNVLGANEHDLRILPNGDALILGFVERNVYLTPQRPDSPAIAQALERITPGDVATFAWDAFDHLDITEVDTHCVSLSTSMPDVTHFNAIEIMDDGNYLISSRNRSQAIKIDSVTGAVLWKLGGVHSDFTFVNDPLNGFLCQHGVRELPNGHIILFDDGNGRQPRSSRAVEYELDTNAMTATMVWSAAANPPLFTGSLGHAQRLPNGNTLIAYGTALHAQEVDTDGGLVWDLSSPTPAYGFYRAQRVDSLYPPAP